MEELIDGLRIVVHAQPYFGVDRECLLRYQRDGGVHYVSKLWRYPRFIELLFFAVLQPKNAMSLEKLLNGSYPLPWEF